MLTIHYAGHRWELRFSWYLMRVVPRIGKYTGTNIGMNYCVWWVGPFELYRWGKL